MKRRFQETDDIERDAYEEHEDVGEDRFVKFQRVSPEEFAAALGGDALREVMTLVDEIVMEEFTSWFADSSAESQEYYELFHGMESDDLSKGLSDGEPFVFDSPDMAVDDSPGRFEEAPFGKETAEQEPGTDDFMVQEGDVEDPDAYARHLAKELCDEIFDEIVAGELSGWRDEAERAEVLAMTELAPAREKIHTAVYQAVLEQWGEKPDASDE